MSASLAARIQKRLKENLANEPAVIQTLQHEGFSREDIDNFGIGFYIANTIEYDASEIQDAYSLLSDKYQEYITLPIYSRQGKIINFIGLDPDNWREGYVLQDEPYNLYQIEDDTAILTEHPLDVLTYKKHGIHNAFTVGSNKSIMHSLNIFKKQGGSDIIVQEHVHNGSKQIQQISHKVVETGLNCYILTITGSLNDYLDSLSPVSMQNLINDTAGFYSWSIHHILNNYDLTSEKHKKDALWEALQLLDQITDPLSFDKALTTLSNQLGITTEQIKEQLNSFAEQKEKNRKQSFYNEVLQDAQRYLEQGKIEYFESYITEKLTTVKNQSVNMDDLKPYTFEELERDTTDLEPSLKTEIKNQERSLMIPQSALTIITARPNHGKTSMLMNLCVDLSRKYSEYAFIFCSYEESRLQIAHKIISIMIGKTINVGQSEEMVDNINHVRGYLKTPPEKRRTTDEVGLAVEEYKELVNQRRLWIFDKPFYIEELANSLTFMSDKYNIGAVFIDYLQKIKISGTHHSRQVELQKVCAQLLETANVTGVPIILGAQLKRAGNTSNPDRILRAENIRESGDIEQDANMVLGLYNHRVENQTTDNEEDILLKVIKARNGQPGEKFKLKFNGPSRKISSIQ